MKKCMTCALENQEGLTCSACGEASWGEHSMPETFLEEQSVPETRPAKAPKQAKVAGK